MVVRVPGHWVALSSVWLALTGCSSNSENATIQPPSSGGGGNSGASSSSAPRGTGGSSTASPSGGASSTGAKTTAGGTSAIDGSSSTKGSGGAPTGGTRATGSTKTSEGTGGKTSYLTGGSGSGGRSTNVGGTKAVGGTTNGNVGGTKAVGGATGGSPGGAKATGGNRSSGGAPSTGAGGTEANGGVAATGGAPSTSSGDCTFSATPSISSKMATVGVVEWSVTGLSNVTSAQVVYTLKNAGSAINKGGSAPVDLTKANNRTLLLGLKQKSDYSFHIEATGSSGICTSDEYTLPTTGSFSNSPNVTRTTGTASASQGKGFIVTSSYGSGNTAFILDADGAVVWLAPAPAQCSRARIDYEGVNVWMLALNVMNGGGEMRFISLDGQTSKNAVSGLSAAHHDFTVLPKKVAALVWTGSGMDPESNLVEMNSDGSGSATTVFKVGTNLYLGGSSAFGGGTNTFHVNSILYHDDGSFSFGDRNPNLYVKASAAGAVQWQFGGTCTNAPAGASKCVAGEWKINHGHHILDNGNILVFNNGAGGMGGASAAHVFEYKLNTSGTMTATLVKDFTTSNTSDVLGDVQRLPNGNTLITYSTGGVIIEVDSSWATVQTLKYNSNQFGYADWRETLYGPPLR